MNTTPDSPALATYRWAPLTQADVPAWADLVNHLAVVDGTKEFYREDDLREELDHAGFDPSTDSIAVWDGETMVAFGQITVPMTPDNDGLGRGHVHGGVRESHRGRGIGRTLMDRLEPRAEELIRERHAGAPAAYQRASGGLADSSAQRMLTRRGYRIVRYWNELARPLSGPVEVPEIEGVTLLSPGAEHEEATRLAHNDAFRDHWGSGPRSPESWHDTWAGNPARLAPSTIAVDNSGAVLAYVICTEYVDRELYVEILGTVRDARGRGLAKATLLRTIDVAGRSGDYDVIMLGVDADSPTGATRLYDAVGFTHKLQSTSMQRDLASLRAVPVGHA